ncbi:MAG: tRNA-dihydrouridine synthase family protein [bacterium]
MTCRHRSATIAGMSSSVTLRNVLFEPALFCAPLSGLTHCSFRRLSAEFGGCGGYFTEMLAGRQILGEDLQRSPYLRRSPLEKRVIYQLMVHEKDNLDGIVGRLSEIGPDGLDINLACHAQTIRHVHAGSRLFDNIDGLAHVLRTVRKRWDGLLTVKIRLGRNTSAYEEMFAERMRLFEDCGVDAVTLHPRFLEDRHGRSARHDRFVWAAAMTRLPIIANGDILGAHTISRNAAAFAPLKGVMVGRMAIAKPWLFAAWDQPVTVDLRETWLRMYEYIATDFTMTEALKRIKFFTRYFARNYQFGHVFYTKVNSAHTLETLLERGCFFLDNTPAVVDEPWLMGL